MMDRIERLIQNLKTGDDKELPDIIQALGVSGDTRAVQPLISIVNGAYLKVREKAAQALGRMADPKAVQSLINALETGYFGVRQEAAEALGKIGDTGAVEPLIAALKDEHFGVRENAARALGKIGDNRAIEHLKVIHADEYYGVSAEHYGVRLAAVDALNTLGVPGTGKILRTVHVKKSSGKVEKLKKRLFNWLGWIRPRIVRALGDTRDERALEPLILALEKGGFRARENALEALSKIGGADAVEPVINVWLTDDYSFVREKAVETLLKIGEPVIEPLINQLGDNDPVINKQTIGLIVRFGEAAVVPLIHAITDNPDARTDAVYILGSLGDTRAVEPLLQVLTGKYEVRLEAVKALGKTGDTRSVKPLIELLKNKNTDASIRAEAANALGILRDTSAVSPLIHALKDGHLPLQIEAAEALGKIGDRRAAETLFKIINKKSSDWEAIKRHSVEEKAVTALGRIGDTRAVEPLLYLDERFMTETVGNVLIELQAKIPGEDLNFFCKKCFVRSSWHNPYLSTPVATNFKYRGMNYYACRMCHSNLYLIQGIKKVVLLLDRHFTKKTIRKGKNRETLIVNWFQREELFDYDEIRITDADDFDVEELVMKLRNDMDDRRRERLPDTPVYLSSGLTLSPAKMNLLKANFLVKIIEL